MNALYTIYDDEYGVKRETTSPHIAQSASLDGKRVTAVFPDEH